MASAQSEENTASEEKTTVERYQEYDEEEVNIALLGKEESGKSNFLNGLQKFIHSKSSNPKLNMKEFPFVSKLPELQASIKDCREEYDLFLFFTTSSELDKYELKVLEIIKSIDKKVFVVLSKMEERAKIVDVYKKNKLFSYTLESVRIHIPEFKEEDIFLIGNKYPDITEWDFEPLIRAILDALPLCIVRRLTPLAAPLLHCDDVDKYADQKPLHELCKLFEKNIPAWSEAEVNIAIIGDGGTGKSSYINAIRGLDRGAEGAAEVGSYCDTTKTPKHFIYPDNPNIRLWDIQGLGSANTVGNDINSYAKNTGLESYDCLLILFNPRLSANAENLARKLQELKKTFFFVFTKADTITENGKDSVEISVSEELEKARACLSKQLKDLGFTSKKQQLFLISNPHPNDYDFEELRQAILDVLPESKRGTLTLSLQVCYTSILEKKFEIVRGNVNSVAAKAAVYCALPVPDALLGYVFDVEVVKKQVEEYRSQFGLDEEGKKYLDKYIKGTKAIVESNETAAKRSGALDLTGFWGGLSATVAAIWSGAKLATKVGGGAATLGLPAVAASYEGWSAQSTLHHCLNNLEKEAEEYLKEIVEKATSATSKVVENQ